MDEMTDVGGRRSEVGGRRLEARGQRSEERTSFIISLSSALCLLFSALCPLPSVYADTIRLKDAPEGKNGVEVEILEEREDSFIVRIPKQEIKLIRRERPTDIKLWQEKRVLWEDAGDYIAVYLPKDKIALPDDYDENNYDRASMLLKDKLKYSAVEGSPQKHDLLSGVGSVRGRVVSEGGQGIAGVKVKIVNVSPRKDLLRIFSSASDPQENLLFEALTDSQGNYEFRSIPLGEYDIYWMPPGFNGWYRRLSDKPDVVVAPGKTNVYNDIEIKN